MEELKTKNVHSQVLDHDLETDFLIVGCGLAGLSLALKLSDLGQVLVLSKGHQLESNTAMAQGGIAAAVSDTDTWQSHSQDTILAGAGLCHPQIVNEFTQSAPQRILDLLKWGVEFNRDGVVNDCQDDILKKLTLTQEGGHSERRIFFVHDHTGLSIQQALLNQVRHHPRIRILEKHFAVELLTSQKADPFEMVANTCLGSYVLDTRLGQVIKILARQTILATGGAGKIYLFTSNWSGATGDGIALAFRAGCRVANLEFMQFHPTCLYHPQAGNFLISEAIRGEGGELINSKGQAFMKHYHPRGSLAPRDIVARSIDSEMKQSGADCVFIDMSHHSAEYLMKRFPVIYAKCKSLGIDMTRQPIPVVPAAHYLCGGVVADASGRTDLKNLFAVGETACTGFHGANRLASNSLLECIVMAHNCSTHIHQIFSDPELQQTERLFWESVSKPAAWKHHHTRNPDEMSLISNLWDEIRRLMWNYVGIVRSNRRLQRARNRLNNLLSEIHEYYWNFEIHSDILELRNLALVADLTVQCALKRERSIGIHYNLDYPPPTSTEAYDDSNGTDTIITP